MRWRGEAADRARGAMWLACLLAWLLGVLALIAILRHDRAPVPLAGVEAQQARAERRP